MRAIAPLLFGALLVWHAPLFADEILTASSSAVPICGEARSIPKVAMRHLLNRQDGEHDLRWSHTASDEEIFSSARSQLYQGLNRRSGRPLVTGSVVYDVYANPFKGTWTMILTVNGFSCGALNNAAPGMRPIPPEQEA